jgi:ABC-type branched-subunit amino acid transport system substrate-binding protein
MGASGTFLLAGCVGDGDETSDNGDETIRIGVSIPQSGNDSRTVEGERLRDGYELAVQNINNGSGAITAEAWSDISGSGGILDRDVELVFEDTGGTESGASDAASTLASDGVDMLTGGAEHAEGVAHQSVAADEELIYMGGFVPSNAVGGESCTQYAFNEMFNPAIATNSLASVLADELGQDEIVNFMQLYLDNEFGDSFSRQFESSLEDVGPEWSMIRRDSASTGRRSYQDAINGVLETGPDMVVLNFYGRDGVNALRDFEELAGEDVTIVVPIIGPQMAEGAGSALEDVYGTTHWLSGLSGFSDSFEAAWDSDRSTENPSQMAHLAYVQVCQWAAAVERAGATDAGGVISELEGREYDLGLGAEFIRQCDHQAMRYAPVVRGFSDSQQSPGSYYELAASIPDAAGNPPYSCNGSPAWNCDL